MLAALALAATITGVQLSHLYSSLVAHCATNCDLATNRFLTHGRFMERTLDLLAQAVPALIGVFWGATLLARELETGTYRLAWTQTVSRSRWLITKLAIGALATVVLAGLVTLTITWWYRALDHVDTTPYAVFDRRDIVPIGYALFAFALGALVGAIIRRTVPAMATTLGVYVLARIAVTEWVRPRLLSPLHATTSLLGAGPPTGSSVQVQIGGGSRTPQELTLGAGGSAPADSWPLSGRVVTSTGHKPSAAQLSTFLHQHCANIAGPPSAPQTGHAASAVAPDTIQGCLNQVAKSFRVLVTYQPVSRYWTFQWLETGVFVALALIAAAGCHLWVTHRTN
jgi:ABC-2 family transporter protein